MGARSPFDSATLMKKGLGGESRPTNLFGSITTPSRSSIHSKSINPSMVELADSSVLAQLGWPD